MTNNNVKTNVEATTETPNHVKTGVEATTETLRIVHHLKQWTMSNIILVQ
jgi:hypothetical protein